MDLETTFKTEVLGVLPRFSKTLSEDRPHIVRDNVRLEEVEKFLSLVAQFELSSKKPYPKTVLITSAVPGEGKSTIVSNIAATHTRYGRKAIIVDCDFRRPTQHMLHKIEHDNGLLLWAARGFPWGDDLLVPGGPLGLSILPDGTHLIPAGGVDLQPGHVLVARQMVELLRYLETVYDVVVLDSPPAGIFQDGLILARYCAETIVVVREGRAHTSQLKKLLGDLEKTQTRALGLILNATSLRNVHPAIGGRYGYGKYGYGKYGSGYYGKYSYKVNGKAHAPSATGRNRAPEEVLAVGGTDSKSKDPANRL
jgi:capsular exopolysaccharide synthesis family protein